MGTRVNAAVGGAGHGRQCLKMPAAIESTIVCELQQGTNKGVKRQPPKMQILEKAKNMYVQQSLQVVVNGNDEARSSLTSNDEEEAQVDIKGQC